MKVIFNPSQIYVKQWYKDYNKKQIWIFFSSSRLMFWFFQVKFLQVEAMHEENHCMPHGIQAEEEDIHSKKKTNHYTMSLAKASKRQKKLNIKVKYLSIPSLSVLSAFSRSETYKLLKS